MNVSEAQQLSHCPSALKRRLWYPSRTTFLMSKRKPHLQTTKESSTPEWLQVAVDAAQLGAWILDFQAGKPKITRTLLGDEMVGDRSHVRTIEQSQAQIYPEDQPRVSKMLEDIAMGRIDDFNVEFRLRGEDGGIRWINSWGKCVRDSDGKVIGLAGVSRDITAMKNLQLDREQFVATLSHDLRNPLAAAKANMDIILRFPKGTEKKEKLLNKAVANIQRADRMIQDLLDATRMRSGRKYDLNYEDGDLADGLCSLVDELSTQHGDRFHFETDGDFQVTWAIEGMRRVIENLAGNAIKYGANDSLITITLSRNADIVTLSVHNEGAPISSEDQKSLFEPFKRTKESEKMGKKGWGLGLTIVRGVAKALGGRIEVQSAPEIGTTFSLIFPGKFADTQIREEKLAG
jgi:signal transduction histidine kinase